MVNRPIKFRAWTGETMLENVSFEPDTNGKNGVIFLQYTGLKDKNGTEIYEGDFLKKQNYTYGLGRKKPNGLKVWLVTWRETASVTGFNISKQYTDKYIVIGNIYQNPELLGGSHDLHQ